MKVFGRQADVLMVDPAQIPCFAENGNIVSIRDALLFPPITPTITTNLTKFKPKIPFPTARASELPKYYSVRVVWAYTPTYIYVQILDEEFSHFPRFRQELQHELENNAPQPSKCIRQGKKPFVLVPYALVKFYLMHFQVWCAQ